MASYAKKNQYDLIDDINQSRSLRKFRGTRIGDSGNKLERRRHGWGYAKRRATFSE
jgi:hypothetical protein